MCGPATVERHYFLDANCPKAFEAAADFRALVMARMVRPNPERWAIVTEMTNKASNDPEYAAMVISAAALLANALAAALALDADDETSADAFGHIVDIAVECGWTI